MNFFNLLFTYQGRINRAKWWIAMLVYVVATLILFMLLAIPVLGWIAAAVLYVAGVVSGVMVGIKRCQDRGTSGWWMALFIGVPVVLGVFTLFLEQGSTLSIVFSLAGFAITIWMTVELGCLRGTVGPNQYGPDPLPHG
jgi:uncharacterized membrane protein YhaH (DUF805 family)